MSELKVIIFESLYRFERNEGLDGWIRGSDVLDPKATLEEVDLLQIENASLRKQVESLEVLVASTASTGEQSIAAGLSVDAKILLLNAKDNGYILYLRHLGGANPTFAIRGEKRLFLGMHRPVTLDFKGVNFQNGL